MLSPADASLVQRDVWLPGLRTLLDADAFLAAMQLSAPAARVRSARLRYLRYKPGQNCLAAYTLEVDGRRVECHAKAYRAVDAGKLAKSAWRPASSGPLGAGRFVWRERGAEVCVFPNDNKLETLALMANAARREDFLRRHLPEHPELWAGEVRTLAYKPERRWTGGLGTAGQPQAVCKLYGSAAFEKVRGRFKQFKSGEVLRVSPLLGRSKGRGVLCFGWQDGRLLSEALADPAFNVGELRRVGVALAELHQQDVPALPVVSRRSEAAALLALGDLLAFLLPEQATRLLQTARVLAAHIEALPQHDATIHGDFYAKQVLLGKSSVALLDLDEAGRGDPVSDLGAFLAHVEHEVICRRLSPARRDEFRATLVEAYRLAANESTITSLEPQIAAKLFARMPHFFRTCQPDWPGLTLESLARVEALLAKVPGESGTTRFPGGRGAHLVRGPEISVAGMDAPETPNLARALDTEVAGPLLRAALQERDAELADVKIRHARLLRHKPGRRALIEYALECRRRDGRIQPLTLLGKLHRRGVDAANLEALWQLLVGSFAPDSRDGISIPRVLGVVPQLGLWLQEKVPGRPAAEFLVSPAGVVAARRAAEALCKLHGATLSLPRQHKATDELRLLRERLDRVAARRPAWQGRLDRVFAACARLAADLPAVMPRLIHRDFYHDQLLIEGGRVWLVDLDLMAAGDPALDAGNFIGHLIEWAVRSPAQQPALADAAAAFTHRYVELAAGGTGEALDTYTTLTLARHIHISTEFPDRAPFTETILEICEKYCGLARTSPRDAALNQVT